MNKPMSTSTAATSAEELIAQDVGARLPGGMMEKSITSWALLHF